VTQSIESAFVCGFRIVMGLCAALSLASFLVAWLMIPKNPDGRP
jgi:phage shock protein PspC (stress-responsive transcriptional regulator)